MPTLPTPRPASRGRRWPRASSASAGRPRPTTTAARGCPAGASRAGVAVEGGDQVLGRLVEVVSDRDPSPPPPGIPGGAPRGGGPQPGERLPGPGDDDLPPRLDGFEESREVRLRL